MAQNTLAVVERETCDESCKAKMWEAIKFYFGDGKKAGDFDFGGEDFAAVTDFYTDNGIAFASDFTKRSLVKRDKRNKGPFTYDDRNIFRFFDPLHPHTHVNYHYYHLALG